MDIYKEEWIKANFPKVHRKMVEFLADIDEYWGVEQPISASQLMYFFDSQGLYIGIIADPDGLEFFTDISAIPIGMSPTRKEAEEKVILECMKTLTDILDGK